MTLRVADPDIHRYWRDASGVIDTTYIRRVALDLFDDFFVTVGGSAIHHK